MHKSSHFDKSISYSYKSIIPAGGRGARWSYATYTDWYRSHQSVAMLLGRSCKCLEKTLTEQL